MINFDTSGISGAIVLTTDVLPAIVDDLTINGPGMEYLEVSGADAYRVFQINSGIAVTITGVTVRDGYASRGGGIWSAGTLHLDSVRIVDNSAPSGINGGYGGGLYVNGGSTALSGTQVLSNTTDCGGGLYVQEGDATLVGTQVAGNTADYGGGVYVRFSDATLSGTQIAGNTASSRGGGLYVEHGSATLNGGGITNNATVGGSGESQYRGNITVADALTVTGEIYQGGGVFTGSGHDLHIVGHTVTGRWSLLRPGFATRIFP